MTSTTYPRIKTDAEMDAIYEDLRAALRRCPLSENMHLSAHLCIGICIENGIDTLPQIVGTLMKLDFKRGHVASFLTRTTGTDPERHLWARDQQGHYRNLDIPSTLPDMG